VCIEYDDDADNYGDIMDNFLITIPSFTSKNKDAFGPTLYFRTNFSNYVKRHWRFNERRQWD